MMRFGQTVTDGVLLTRHGDVHRNRGRLTECGCTITAGRVAKVSHVQAVVFKLALCHLCFPVPQVVGHQARRRELTS